MNRPQHTDKLSVPMKEVRDRLQILEREYQSQRQELRAAYQEIEILTALQDVALALTSTRDPEPLLRQIVGAAMDLLQAQGSSLMLLLENSGELVFQVVIGEVSQKLVGRRIRVGEGISGWVAQTGEAALVNDVQNDPRFASSVDASTGFRTESLLCVPMQFQDRRLGVLSVVNKAGPTGFEAKDVEWLKALASLAAVAIENVRLYQRLRQERDRVVIAQEELRKKLARDLHDGPTQVISTIVMQIEFIKKLLQHDPDNIAEELDLMGETGQQAIRGMRTVLFDLRPLILETQGLGPALELFTERHRVEGKPEIHLHTAESVGRYDAKIESAVFSIIQEAVNNALKHAQAQNIWLRLAQKETTLVVEIEDDGVGFHIDAVMQSYENRGSLGMVSMRERAELVGGELTVISAPGKGTTVVLRVAAEVTLPREEEAEWLSGEREEVVPGAVS